MKIKHALVLCALCLLCLPASAANQTPDELFPEQSRAGLARLDAMMQQEQQRRAAMGESWESPALKDKPVTHGELITMKRDLDEIKRRLAAQPVPQAPAMQPMGGME